MYRDQRSAPEGKMSNSKLRHAAGLALVGWYLIEPPFVPAVGQVGYEANPDGPFSQWYHVAWLR